MGAGICREIRDLVHEADAEVAETIKRSVQPYFVLDGNVCALLAAKDHVNVFLYDGAMVPSSARRGALAVAQRSGVYECISAALSFPVRLRQPPG